MANEGKAWRCAVCGYIHYGDEPPAECPVCGASAGEFELIEQAPPVEADRAAGNRIVITGAGIAGLSAAEGAREASPDAEIMLLSAEEELPYYRLNLTRYLAGEIAGNELLIHPPEWYRDNRIDLQLGKRLQLLSETEQYIELTDGGSVEYDKLIVATGAHPFVPPIPGHELPHVFTLRTANDAKAILAAVKRGTQVICIGGGILGMETAGALSRRGAKVTVLEAFDHLMPRQLNAEGSTVLARHLQTLDIEVMIQTTADRIESDRIVLSDGSTLAAEMVVITVGVRSNTEALADAGLPVNRGVLVDNFMRTSNPNVLAAGDVCEHDGVMYGSWAAAQYQGKIAGMNAAGVATEFGGIPRTHTLKVLGRDMFSIGAITPSDGSCLAIDEHFDGGYRMFMMHDGAMIGALLIGDLSLVSACRKAIESASALGSLSTAEAVVAAITAN